MTTIWTIDRKEAWKLKSKPLLFKIHLVLIVISVNRSPEKSRGGKAISRIKRDCFGILRLPRKDTVFIIVIAVSEAKPATDCDPGTQSNVHVIPACFKSGNRVI